MAAQALNLIQWEQNVKLTEEEEQLIQLIESAENSKLVIKSSREEIQQQNEIPHQLMTVVTLLDKNNQIEDSSMDQIESILQEYEKKNQVFKELLKNLKVISGQLDKLQEDKDKVIQGINQFHSQSNLYIQQQKSMIEMQSHIQEYLQYYTNINKLTQEIESSLKIDPTQRGQFEINLQRLMSEITDGILFFDSKPSFTNSQKCLELYKQLKKKLLTLTKSHLFRILNNEFSFINSRFAKFKTNDILPCFYPFFLRTNEDKNSELEVVLPNPQKSQFLQIVFPQFIDFLKVYNSKDQKTTNLDEEFEKFKIKESLQNFFHFLQSQIDKDQDINELYNDVFLEFQSYCRSNLHQLINESIQKQLSNAYQLATTLINTKMLSQRKDVRDHKVPFEPIIVETLLAFLFEIILNESLYFRMVFSANIKVIEDNNHNLQAKILYNYQQTIRIFIQRVTNLDSLIEMSTICNEFNSKTHNFIKLLYNNKLKSDNYISQTLNQILKELVKILLQTLNRGQLKIMFYQTFQVEFIEKLRLEIMSRIISICHQDIQEKIYSFNIKEYIRLNGVLTIYKFIPKGHQQPRGYKLQKDEVFPTVERGVSLILKLAQFVDKKFFEQIAGEVLREVNNQIKDVTQSYQLKFDSYVFVLKQLLILSDSLLPIGGNFILKESELDFSETKTILLQIISGQLRPDFRWIELTSAEKLWSYTTNFFQFIYKGMPKVNQYEIDLKQNLIYQLKNVGFSFVKDMTFVIAKNLIDFLRKFQYLQYIIEKQDELSNDQDEKKHQLTKLVSKEQAQKDFYILINVETISKTYNLFVENLFDFTDEMVSKLNNYLNQNMFDKMLVLDTLLIIIQALYWRYYLEQYFPIIIILYQCLQVLRWLGI